MKNPMCSCWWLADFCTLWFSFFFIYPQNAFATTKKLQIDAIYTLSFSFSDNIELCNFLVSIGVRLIFFIHCAGAGRILPIYDPLKSPPPDTPPSTRALYPISQVRNVVVLCEWVCVMNVAFKASWRPKRLLLNDPDKSKMLFIVYLKQALLQSSKATRARSYHQVCSWIYPVKHPVRKWTNQNDQMKYYWKKVKTSKV